MKKQVSLWICSAFFFIVIMYLKTTNVYAKTTDTESDEIVAETAYLDMSSVGPLYVDFIEDEANNYADYYYAAKAFHILQEKEKLDPMYSNCREVIVTVTEKAKPTELLLVYSKREPKVQTGYLNLTTEHLEKFYTIDDVIIHIQRGK